MPQLIFFVLLFTTLACDDGRSRDLLPPSGFVGNSLHGERLYKKHCFRCHGSENHQRKIAPFLFQRQYAFSEFPDRNFYLAVNDGQDKYEQFPAMPAIEQLDAKQTAHIVAYIRKAQQTMGIR